MKHGLNSLTSLMQTGLNFPDVSISLQVSKKLIWKISPLPPPHPPIPFHLQVMFASKKTLHLCSQVEAIFLLCFAIPDEYLYLHLCYRVAEHCLKLNHEATAFFPSYPCSDLGSTFNSSHLCISSISLAIRSLHLY